jgi:hypothetical protein
MQPKNVFRGIGPAAIVIAAMSAVAIQSANATESGTSLYLLSSKGQGGGQINGAGELLNYSF